MSGAHQQSAIDYIGSKSQRINQEFTMPASFTRSPWQLLAAFALASCTGSIDSAATRSNRPDGAVAPTRSGGGAGGSAGARPSAGGAGAPPAAACDAFRPGPPALRRLTRRQYLNAVSDLLGAPAPASLALPGDEQVGVFMSNDAEIPTEAAVTQYAAAAEGLASGASARLWKQSACAATNAGCAATFVGSVVTRAFRRTVAADELAAYTKLFTAARTERSPEESLRLVLQAVMQSPHFVYQVEQHGPVDATTNTAPLTSDSLAARLAFALTAAPPDAELVAAAKAGELTTSAGLEKHARRLLGTARGTEALRDFVAQWLSLDEIERTSLDPKLYPEYTPELRAAMQKETADRVDAVLAQRGGSVVALLSAPETVFSSAIGKLYGVAGTSGALVDLDRTKRAGVLTSPAFLAVTHGAVLRGKTILRDLLCEEVPPPPRGVDTRLPALAPGQTPRTRLEMHAQTGSCKACHDRMDAVGFAFEGYDDLGRVRDRYSDGQAVDATGSATFDGEKVSFDGAPALIKQLAGGPQVAACVGKQAFRFLAARVPTEADGCTIERAVTAYRAKGDDLRELVVALVTSPAFTRVTPAAR